MQDGFDNLKSLPGSGSVASKTSECSSSSSISFESSKNLKLIAEKLVEEQASVKSDLEMTNSKLEEHIRLLEEKLLCAFSDNAKLKVKQKEDEKLWKALESKFSSTDIPLSHQLTETIQHLASQVQDEAEGSQLATDLLNEYMDGLSLKLSTAEETIRNRRKQIEELKFEKEENDRLHKDEHCRTANLVEVKDALTKKFEATVAAIEQAAKSLNSILRAVQLELRSKEDEIKCLLATQENLEKEKSDFMLINNECAKKLSLSLQKIKNLEGFVAVLAAQLVELVEQNAMFAIKFDELNSLYETCFELVQQERDPAAKHAQKKYEQLHDKFLCITAERDALQFIYQEYNNKTIELQKAQESVMSQLSEECRFAKERMQKLESEVESLVSKKTEAEKLVLELEEKIDTLSESSRSSENKMQDFLQKILALELENKDNTEKMQAEIQGKTEEIDNLEKERKKHEVQVDSLEKLVLQQQNLLEEKEVLILEYKERGKKLEDLISEKEAMLTAAKSKLVEARRQYDVMLESKQEELSIHLKEISQRNDQAIDEIRRKYEVEKQEIVNLEKEKADKVVKEMEQKLADCKEESRLHLLHVQVQNAALVTQLQQEHEAQMKVLQLHIQKRRDEGFMPLLEDGPEWELIPENLRVPPRPVDQVDDEEVDEGGEVGGAGGDPPDGGGRVGGGDLTRVQLFALVLFFLVFMFILFVVAAVGSTGVLLVGILAVITAVIAFGVRCVARILDRITWREILCGLMVFFLGGEGFTGILYTGIIITLISGVIGFGLHCVAGFLRRVADHIDDLAEMMGSALPWIVVSLQRFQHAMHDSMFHDRLYNLCERFVLALRRLWSLLEALLDIIRR